MTRPPPLPSAAWRGSRHPTLYAPLPAPLHSLERLWTPYLGCALPAARGPDGECADVAAGSQDLLLIHWPGASKLPLDSPKHAELRGETWRALEDLYDSTPLV